LLTTIDACQVHLDIVSTMLSSTTLRDSLGVEKGDLVFTLLGKTLLEGRVY